MGCDREPVWRVAAAVACGAVLFFFGTGFDPVPVLTWLAPLPVLLVAARLPAWAAIVAAFLSYALGTANSWAFQLRSHDEPMWPVGVVINVGMSVVFVLAVWAFRHQVRRRRPVLAAFAAPAVWTGALYVVSVTNPMGLMGTFANHQADVPVVVQAAAVAGMWGVEFLVVLLPAAIAAAVSARSAPAATAIGLVVLVLGASALRLAGDDGPAAKVAAVATNQRTWAPDLATPEGRDLAAGYAAAIGDLPGGLDVVVLPEQSFRPTDARPAVLADTLGRAARDHGTDVVVGFAHWSGNAKFNYALVFPADGGEPLRYLKHHDTVSPGGEDLLLLPDGRTGVEICFDVNFRDPSRAYAAAGARLLAVPASDEDDNGWQHSRMALLRGVENGLAVVWSGRTGTVMISDDRGRVLADARTGGATPFTAVVADVPVGSGSTPYTRFGNWFAYLCLVVAVGVLFVRRRGIRRAPEES
ncbi:nitrilase-related carbon-nitrogen hydrolase [Actinosynnema sp. NPDC047251]|uniref:Nitrilase/cyanide hydratase and apolipoprotein N-acyltransferase n=1 Tax=Saccharothrix espanaensis (strain ATCC 51144 / DSM 44229 / JCM 9112 / NBRC 15066 / NRRL 15764) TaxID=1179773 RepID=K0K2L2_SACES|nr:nitrilase-related carbon-nitrogen hydrolase [Saccharothrix espanaensis]CCH30798.1 Nitrilase/cyanide hydratase and apolipoprotein N-acyltransferase [Saccharothrix espanaensis DSM 44229]